MWVSWEVSGFCKELPKPTSPLGRCLHLRPSSVTARAQGCRAGQTVPMSSPGRCLAPRSPDFLPVRPVQRPGCAGMPGAWSPRQGPQPVPVSGLWTYPGTGLKKTCEDTAHRTRWPAAAWPLAIWPQASLCGFLTRGPPWDRADWDLRTRVTGRRVFLFVTRIISAE